MHSRFYVRKSKFTLSAFPNTFIFIRMISSSGTCIPRLRKEYKELQLHPVEHIRASPKESNILEWHYVIEGAKSTLKKY